MKIVSLFAIFILLGVAGYAQDAKVVAEFAAKADKAVKNAPFSAEAISESVQTLADGNRIVRKSTSKLYRNSEGRFRREFAGGSGGMLGSFYTFGHGVSLLDPVGGFRYMIDPNLKTTRQMVIDPKIDIKIVNGAVQSLEGAIAAAKARGDIKTTGGTVVITDKLREELKAAVAVPAPAPMPRIVAGPVGVEPLMGVGMPHAFGSHKWETRTEQLGVQNIEGVDAEGTRTITTIPADAIGNERPIEITYEKWFSNELQLVVMSKHNDPRFGEQTYRVTNIVRSEPDASLFTPPQGYKLITEPSGSYRVTTAKAAQAERAAKAAKATTVSQTKP